MFFSPFPRGFDYRNLKNVLFYSALAVIPMLFPPIIVAFWMSASLSQVVLGDIHRASLVVWEIVFLFSVAFLFSLLGFRRSFLQPFFISTGAYFVGAWITYAFASATPLNPFALVLLILGGLLLVRSVSKSWCVAPPLVPTRR